tara:strand:+ start:9908 stop:10090 length:183 start_codon:yes stop_codon:yes gene_type:complete
MSELFIEHKKVTDKIEIWEVFLHTTKIAVFFNEDGRRNAKLFVKAYSEIHDIPNFIIKEL